MYSCPRTSGAPTFSIHLPAVASRYFPLRCIPKPIALGRLKASIDLTRNYRSVTARTIPAVGYLFISRVRPRLVIAIGICT